MREGVLPEQVVPTRSDLVLLKDEPEYAILLRVRVQVRGVRVNALRGDGRVPVVERFGGVDSRRTALKPSIVRQLIRLHGHQGPIDVDQARLFADEPVVLEAIPRESEKGLWDVGNHVDERAGVGMADAQDLAVAIVQELVLVELGLQVLCRGQLKVRLLVLDLGHGSLRCVPVVGGEVVVEVGCVLLHERSIYVACIE